MYGKAENPLPALYVRNKEAKFLAPRKSDLKTPPMAGFACASETEAAHSVPGWRLSVTATLKPGGRSNYIVGREGARTVKSKSVIEKGGVWSAVGFSCLIRTISFSSAMDFSFSPSAL